MLVKVTLLFLLGMVLIAMIGRALFPGALRRIGRGQKPATCPRCGRYRLGRGPCDCGSDRKV